MLPTSSCADAPKMPCHRQIHCEASASGMKGFPAMSQ
jgi:hypothetical protein